MIVAMLAAIWGMALFPAWAGLALGRLIERLEVARWWAASTLATAIAAVGCVIYRDAVRLDYARVLAGLWREWAGG